MVKHWPEYQKTMTRLGYHGLEVEPGIVGAMILHPEYYGLTSKQKARYKDYMFNNIIVFEYKVGEPFPTGNCPNQAMRYALKEPEKRRGRFLPRMKHNGCWMMLLAIGMALIALAIWGW